MLELAMLSENSNNPSNEILLLDIDDTLLDHSVWRPLRDRKTAERIGITYEKYMELHEAYKASLTSSFEFTTPGNSAFIAARIGCDPDVITSMYLNEECLQAAIFPDVEEFLTKLGTTKRLGIFSAGDPAIQLGKLKGMRLLRFFDPSLEFITPRKTAPEFIDTLPLSTIVDDSEKILLDISEARLTPILIDRKNNNVTWAKRRISTLLELL